jgi:DNA-binding MarR family transcriptional regulator
VNFVEEGARGEFGLGGWRWRQLARAAGAWESRRSGWVKWGVYQEIEVTPLIGLQDVVGVAPPPGAVGVLAFPDGNSGAMLIRFPWCKGLSRDTVSSVEERCGAPSVGSHLGVAFSLAQLGAHVTGRYRQRMAELDLTPAETGLLLRIARTPGQSQQALADALGTPPTRLVAMLDGLESRGAIERRRNPADRRFNAVYLTDDGEELRRAIARVATAHERDITAALDDNERAQLRGLLGRISDQQGLIPGVHPGYRNRPPAGTACP